MLNRGTSPKVHFIVGADEYKVETISLPHFMSRKPFLSEYKCMIWNTRKGLSSHEMRGVAGFLLDTDCRYVVCGGVDCETWHDAVDAEFLFREYPPLEYERRFVMTTWHEDESPGEVAWFLVHCTGDDAGGEGRFLVLIVGQDRRLQTRIVKAVKKFAREKRNSVK